MQLLYANAHDSRISSAPQEFVGSLRATPQILVKVLFEQFCHILARIMGPSKQHIDRQTLERIVVPIKDHH